MEGWIEVCHLPIWEVEPPLSDLRSEAALPFILPGRGESAVSHTLSSSSPLMVWPVSAHHMGVVTLKNRQWIALFKFMTSNGSGWIFILPNLFLQHIVFPPFFYFLLYFFFMNRLPQARYWTYEDATWYGRSLGASLFLHTGDLEQSRSQHQVQGQILKILRMVRNVIGKVLEMKICKFCTWPSPNYSKSSLKRVKMAYKWGYKLITQGHT